jgi:glycosyltransferase involved in cell wall biosynthesis
LKVVHIIKSLGRGGAETLLVETLKHHSKEQYSFQFLYFLPWKNQLVPELNAKGGGVTCMNAASNLAMLFKIPALVKWLKQEKVDLVHAHLPWAGIVARVACKLAGVPLIYTEHNVQERYHWSTRLLNKLTFDWQSRVLAVSADVARSIKEHIGNRVPVQIVYNGIDDQRFERQPGASAKKKMELGFEEDAIVVGTVAVFRLQKRLDLWLQVFEATSRQYPNLRGIIVGDGPLKAELYTQAKQLGIEKKLLFPGIQTDTPLWLSVFDIFLMSSDFEGLPLALLEAMSCGCAIVATEAGGIPEVVVHQDQALLSPVGDAAALTANLQQACSSQDLRKQLSAAARERVIQNFSVASMVHTLETLYTSVSPKPITSKMVTHDNTQ